MTAPPMRLSVDATAVPASPAGAGRYTVDLLRALGARPDVVLTVWARRSDARRWPAIVGPMADVLAAAPDRRPLRLAWEQIGLPRRLGRQDVHVHHAPHYTMPEHSPVPVVVTIHDLTFFDHPEWHQRAKVPVFRRAIRSAASRADALVCVSRETAERLRALCHPTARIFVVPHGVDHGRFRPQEATAGSDLQILDLLGVRRPYVLFLGTLEPRKSVPQLVAAFDRVAGSYADVQLVLAGGDGWGGDAVSRAVAGARHGSRVLRTGYVPDIAVPALLRQAEVVAYPALQEGFGLPALEALACGTPLVTSSGTVMADLAGAAAITAAPGSIDELAAALDEALLGGSAAPKRRQLGFGVAAGYTWAASATGHLAAYRWAASAAAAGSNRAAGGR